MGRIQELEKEARRHGSSPRRQHLADDLVGFVYVKGKEDGAFPPGMVGFGLAGRCDALLHFEAPSSGYKGGGPSGVPGRQIGPALATDLRHVAEPLGRDECSASAAPLQQGIG
jgi:hypothetical protein